MIKVIDIYKTLGIRREEGMDVLLFVLYSFFIGVAVYVYYIVATSLFLTDFEKSMLPIAYIAGGVLLYVLGRLNTELQKRIKFSKLASAMLIFFMASLGALLLAYQFSDSKWVTLSMFLWIRVAVYISTVTLWLPSSAVFNLQQAKRLFSLIGMGDVLASIFSSFLVGFLVGGEFMKTEGMLYICLFFLAIAFIVMMLIIRRHRGELAFTKSQEKQPLKKSDGKMLGKYFKSNYFLLVFFLGMMPIFGLYILEFIFSVEIKVQFPEKDQMTAFLGQFLFICALVELIVKVFLYRIIINTFGIISGIIILPLSLIVVFAFAAMMASVDLSYFFYILLGRFLLSSVRKSFTDTSFQILYQPLPKEESISLQGQVEVYAKPLGYVLAGILLLILVYTGIGSSVNVIYIFLVILIGWSALSLRMKVEYQNMLSSLFNFTASATKVEDAEEEPEDRDSSLGRMSLESVIEKAQSEDEVKKLEGIMLLGKSKRFLSSKYLIPHLQSRNETVRVAAIAAAGENGNPELWSHLFDNIQANQFVAETQEALTRIGEPVIPAINHFFNQSGERIDIQLVCVKVVSAIGGAKALRFLRQQLNDPTPMVRDIVYQTLAGYNYQANLNESAILVQEIRFHISFLVWLTAAQRDLFSSFYAGRLVRPELHNEYNRGILKLLNILTILSGDSRLFYIQDSISSENENTRSYLLEILNMAIPPEHQSHVIPLFEEGSLSEKVLKFRSEFPQQKLSDEDRLYDIVNKDFSRLGLTAKLAAIRELEVFPSVETSFILAANAVSPVDEMAVEALDVLFKTDQEAFERLVKTFELNKDVHRITMAEEVRTRNANSLINTV